MDLLYITHSPFTWLFWIITIIIYIPKEESTQIASIDQIKN